MLARILQCHWAGNWRRAATRNVKIGYMRCRSCIIHIRISAVTKESSRESPQELFALQRGIGSQRPKWLAEIVNSRVWRPWSACRAGRPTTFRQDPNISQLSHSACFASHMEGWVSLVTSSSRRPREAGASLTSVLNFVSRFSASLCQHRQHSEMKVYARLTADALAFYKARSHIAERKPVLLPVPGHAWTLGYVSAGYGWVWFDLGFGLQCWHL